MTATVREAVPFSRFFSFITRPFRFLCRRWHFQCCNGTVDHCFLERSAQSACRRLSAGARAGNICWWYRIIRWNIILLTGVTGMSFLFAQSCSGDIFSWTLKLKFCMFTDQAFSNVDIFNAATGKQSFNSLSEARQQLAATSLPVLGLAFFAGGFNGQGRLTHYPVYILIPLTAWLVRSCSD
jgi:hypothetical protein